MQQTEVNESRLYSIPAQLQSKAVHREPDAQLLEAIAACVSAFTIYPATLVARATSESGFKTNADIFRLLKVSHL